MIFKFRENNIISIFNNGKGIPVVEHKDEKMYVPTLIFGHLLTSSNYNDEEEKVTGGRNGYGAKLCNIFSTKFVLETASKEYKKCFKQTWQNNMSKTSNPVLKDFSGTDFTRVTFSADLPKFKVLICFGPSIFLSTDMNLIFFFAESRWKLWIETRWHFYRDALTT